MQVEFFLANLRSPICQSAHTALAGRHSRAAARVLSPSPRQRVSRVCPRPQLVTVDSYHVCERSSGARKFACTPQRCEGTPAETGTAAAGWGGAALNSFSKTDSGHNPQRWSLKLVQTQLSPFLLRLAFGLGANVIALFIKVD